MIRSLLAISEGGPDAATSFGLAARLASQYGVAVDALHLPTAPGGISDALGLGTDVAPLVAELDEVRLDARAAESRRHYEARLLATKGATWTRAEHGDRALMIRMGRANEMVLLGRPGGDPENIAPATVEAALYECAGPVMIAPPSPGAGPFRQPVVAWNASHQAARALNYALPFLAAAGRATLLCVGPAHEDYGAAYVARQLKRHGIECATANIDPGAVSGRARGRALLGFVHEQGGDLLVMGAYGRNQALSFLGLGGATGKVISSCRAPLLMAH